MSSKFDRIVKDMSGVISTPNKRKTTPYDTTATVVRIEGNTAWVHIDGGVDETPAMMTINARVGDIVRIRNSGGKVWIIGNTTSPPTDDRRANQAHAIALDANAIAANAEKDAFRASVAAESAEADASTARESAQSATASANSALKGLSTVEDVVDTLNWITAHGEMESQSGETFDTSKVYFIVDPNGDYVVQNVHYSIVTNPEASQIANYYCLEVDESIQNYIATHVVVDGEGLWLIPESNGNKVLIATGSGTTYTSAGTYIIDENGGILAQFLKDGITIGVDDGSQSYLYADFHSLQLIDKEGNPYFYVSDLRDEYGEASITSTFAADGRTYFALDPEANSTDYTVTVADGSGGNITKGKYGFGFETAPTAAVTVSYKTESPYAKAYTFGTRTSDGRIGPMSVAEGHLVRAVGNTSHAEGANTLATGAYSHAEGFFTAASKTASHAEGYYTQTTGAYSHAEGYSTFANGQQSHAEGNHVYANGSCAHAEGYQSEAYGDYSHARNLYTVANRKSQTALGEYNVVDSVGADETARGAYAVIVGNGSSWDARSNALTVDWNGNISRYTGWDGSSVPSANNEKNYEALDTSGRWVGRVSTVVYGGSSSRSGQVGTLISARHPSAPGNPNTIGIYQDDTGAMDYTISDPAKFRTALGITDRVIAQGTSSSWTYRKWSSGKIEAWYSYTGTAGSSTAWSSPIRYKDVTIAIPSDIFSSAPGKVLATSFSNQSWVVHAKASSATSISVRLATVATGNITPSIKLYCVSA